MTYSNPVTMTPSDPTQALQIVLNYAAAQVGKPYNASSDRVRFGPNSYDCSGLVYMAYKQVNVPMATYTFAAVNNGDGLEVTGGIANWMPGDLVYKSGGSPKVPNGHVIMYLGNNKFVAAQAPAIGIVFGTITDISEVQHVRRMILGANYDRLAVPGPGGAVTGTANTTGSVNSTTARSYAASGGLPFQLPTVGSWSSDYNMNEWWPESWKKTDNAKFMYNEHTSHLAGEPGGFQRGYLIGDNRLVSSTKDKDGNITTTVSETSPVGPRLHFMFNPSELEQRMQATIGVDIGDQADSQKSITSPGQVQFDFTMLFNREAEINTAIDENEAETYGGQARSPRKIGVLHDIQLFQELTMVEASGQNIMVGDATTASGSGVGGIVMQNRYVKVFFSEYLVYAGWITDAVITYAKFSHSYVPTVAKIDVHMVLTFAGAAAQHQTMGFFERLQNNLVGMINRALGATNTTALNTVKPTNAAAGYYMPTQADFAPVGRRLWGSPAANDIDAAPYISGFPLQSIIIHHSQEFTKVSGQTDYEAEVAALIKSNMGWVKGDTTGQIDMNYAVGQSGHVYEAHGTKQQQAPLSDTWTHGAIHICALGNFDAQQPTPEMIEGIQNCISWLVGMGYVAANPTNNPAGSKVYTHQSYKSTISCPGSNLTSVISRFQLIPLTDIPQRTSAARVAI